MKARGILSAECTHNISSNLEIHSLLKSASYILGVKGFLANAWD